MKNTLTILAVLLISIFTSKAQEAAVHDDFEGNGNITTWFGDGCGINTDLPNPIPMGINTSATVMEYDDSGGQFANVRFDVDQNFDLSINHTFSIKLYVPASGLTGNQTNQVSLKLQDGTLGAPWSTQSEIIKPIALDRWQTVTFDFENDNYINLDGGSPPPVDRTDFNRVVIQVNGEDNTDHVLAYLDDIVYDGSFPTDTVLENLVWSDEFDVAGAVDPGNWFHQTQLPAGGSWYNGEIQHYTDRLDNAIVEDGVLKIIAKKESFTDQGYTKQYTSARLNAKFAFTYGKVEIRAKLPSGIGTWPAIWMLGRDINEDGAYWDNQGYGTTPWPACGEIDIMEHWGDNQNYIQSATHTPSSSGATINLGGQSIPSASTAFHTYTLDWTQDQLIFSVDDVVHYTYNPPVKNADTWPFDSEQYLLLNIAILPNIGASFTSGTMEIDYIRVYQEGPVTNLDMQVDRITGVYPNPIMNELNIQLDQIIEDEIAVSLFGIDGRLIDQYFLPIDNSKITLNDLGHLAPGIYVVSFSIDQKSYAVKVIKN